MYASLVLVYNKSSVLLSQVQFWVKVGRIEDKEMWLKSPAIRKGAWGFCVFSLLGTEWIKLQTGAAIAVGEC